MNFNRHSASVFAQIAKHKNFPRQTTITQLRKPQSTDEDATPPPQTYRHIIRRKNTTDSNTCAKISIAPPSATRIKDPSEILIHVRPPRHPSLPQKPHLLRYDQFDLSTTPLNDLNVQIGQAVQSKDFVGAEHLFKTIRERRITPDFTTLNRMLEARAQTSRGTRTDTGGIMELFDELVTRYKPDDVSHSAVLSGLFYRSHQVADSLQKSHNERSLVASGCHALEPLGYVRLESDILLLEAEMTKLCNLMWEYFHQLSVKSAKDYLRIGAAVSFRADVDRMDELRKSMPGDAMTARMYFYLINTYGSSNQFAKAKDFFATAINIRDCAPSDRADIYRVFAKVCLKNGELAEAIKLIDAVAAEKLDSGIQSSIMLGCFEGSNESTALAVEMLDRVEQLWPKNSTDMGRVSNFTDFACGALVFAINKKNTEFAADVIGRLSARDPLPVDTAQGIAVPLRKYVDQCLVAGQKKEALQAVRFMLRCKVTPDPKSVSSLLLSEGKLAPSISASDADEILTNVTAILADPKRLLDWNSFAVDYRSLVKQLAGDMIGSRCFALSAARLGPREPKDETWTKFIANLKNTAKEMHPVIAQVEHPTALELAARSDDTYEICTIVNAMRSGDLVPLPVDTPTYEQVLKAITEKGDLLSLGWWRSNACRLASHEPCLKKDPRLLVNRVPTFEKPPVSDKKNTIVIRAALRGDLDTVLKSMPEAVPTLVFSTVQNVFRTYGSKKDFAGSQAIATILEDAAKKAVNEQQKDFLERMAPSGLAIACIFGGEYKSAKDILDYMVTKKGLKPEADVYAYYISQQRWVDPTMSAYQIFQEVLSLGIKPTTFFLNTVLHKFGLGRRMDHAFEVFDQFKKNKLKPDDITYGSAINSAVRVANEEVAVQLFSEYLQQKYIKRTCVPFNIMMQYYVGTHKNRDAVLYYWNLLHAEEHTPSRVAYLSLLQAYTCLLPVDMNRAETLLKEIEEPTGSQYAALIFGYGYRLGDFQAADSVMDRMLKRLKKNGTNSVMEPEQAWEALVASYVAHKNIQGAKQARALMVKSMPHLPQLYLDNALIRGCALFDEDEEEHIGTARAMYDAMADKSKDLRTPDTYAAMIAVYLKFGQDDKAREVLASMRARKFPYRVMKDAEELVEDPMPEKVEHWVMTNMLRLPALQ